MLCAAQSYVILRQNYLMGGEEQINIWHQLFIESRAKASSGASSAGVRGAASKARGLLSNLNPRAQVRLPNPPRNPHASQRAACMSACSSPFK